MEEHSTYRAERPDLAHFLLELEASAVQIEAAT
jgi:hypothetical protein